MEYTDSYSFDFNFDPSSVSTMYMIAAAVIFLALRYGFKYAR